MYLSQAHPLILAYTAQCARLTFRHFVTTCFITLTSNRWPMTYGFPKFVMASALSSSSTNGDPRVDREIQRITRSSYSICSSRAEESSHDIPTAQ
jgi:hypothetical protein